MAHNLSVNINTIMALSILKQCTLHSYIKIYNIGLSIEEEFFNLALT